VIAALDVIWIYDQNIDPKKWKMAVIIEPDCLFYFRINSRDHWKPCIPLGRDPHHLFLDHDSYLECNLPQELTEFDVEEAFNKKGVIGRVHGSLARLIYELVKVNTRISAADKKAIGIALVGLKHL
jgi:hypothetical protein